MKYFYLLFCAFVALSVQAQQTVNARLDYCFNREDLFPPAPGITGEVFHITQQPDGKILVSGTFSAYNNTPVNNLIRLMPNGLLDPSFNPPALGGSLYGSLVQTDGKIVVWGNFTFGATSHLIRLMPDGSVDASFNMGTGLNGYVESGILQSDGKIVLVGNMSLYNGASALRMLRLNSDGTRDASFTAAFPLGAGIRPTYVARQTDGKYVVGGNFTTYNAVACERIVRLNADGTRDASFASGVGAGANSILYGVALRPDGKMWISGAFTSYGGVGRNRIALLNADGTLDLTTNIGTGASNTLWPVALQADGKLYICGNFSTYNGAPANCLARLNADGSLDASFSTGGGFTGPSRVVFGIFVQPDGRILLGGRFTAYSGVGRNGVTRIMGDQTPVLYVAGGSPSTSITAGSISPAAANGTNFGVSSPCAAVVRQFTITNTGNSDLNLSLPVSLAGAGATHFSIVSQPAQTTLVPGESTTFSIQAAASVGGTHTATVTIGSNYCGLVSGDFKFNISTDGSAAGFYDINRARALLFDGTNDFVDVGNNIQSIPNITIEAWIRPNGSSISTAFEEICSKERINSFAVNRITGKLHVNFGDGTNWGTATESSTSIPYNRWTHVAATRNAAGQVHIYINGVLDASGTNANTGTNANLRAIGHKPGVAFNVAAFGGHIDELRIWSVPRTAQEIRENMHLTLSNCETGLLAYYQFNSSPGSTTAVDATNTFPAPLSGMNVVTSWQNMGVNVGQDLTRISNSQSVFGVANQTLHNFAAANIEVEFTQVNTPQDYTVTYQAFAPNSLTGASGAAIFSNPVWTLNSSLANGSQQMNIRFTLPAGNLSSSDPSKYRLFWRPMYSDGDWTMIDGTANSISGNTIRFTNLRQIGQYMIVRNSNAEISDVRGGMYHFGDASGGLEHIVLNNSSQFDINTTGDFTVEAWVRRTQAGRDFFFSHMNANAPVTGYQLLVENTNKFIAEFRVNGVPYDVIGTTNINIGEWYHLAMTLDRSTNTVRLYVNGVLDASRTDAAYGSNFSNPAPVYIGVERTLGTVHEFDGFIDEVRVWRSLRSQNELRENMHLTLKGTETGLVSYYQFNKDQAVGSANSVIDAMGNNHGNCVNMSAAHARSAEVPVAGGVSDRLTVSAAGNYLFSNTGLSINFTDNPNGEIVVSRLQTEQPHGVSSIPATDVDDEYFVVWNYGTNPTPAVSAMEFSRLTHIDGINTAADIALYKRGSRQYGNTWGTPIATATSIGTGVNTALFTGAPLTSGFSQFVVAANASTNSLPIELQSFEAQRLDAVRAELNWSTESEQNNKGFWIERMRQNETTFSPIAWQDGLNRAGSYHFIDENAGSGICYYRLRQIDLQGEGEQLSAIRAISALEESAEIALFPNPSSEQIYLRLPRELQSLPFGFRLFDSSGRLLKEQNNAEQQGAILQTAELPSGLYWLQLRFADGQQYSLPFRRP